MKPLGAPSANGQPLAGTPPRRARLDALQGLRGCAALLVVVGHSIAIFEGASSADAAGTPDITGSLGVSAFFVVSGFLMVYVHGNDFGQRGSSRSFYARRIARIVPLYWLVTICYGLKQVYFQQDSVLNILKSLIFLPYQTDDDLWRPVLGQGWTLNYEMFFYLIFGIGLYFSRGRWLVYGTLGLLVLLNYVGFFNRNDILDFWSNPIVLYFLGGVTIGLIRRRVAKGPSFRVAFVGSIATLAFAAAAVGASIVPAPFVPYLMPMAATFAVGLTALAREDLRQSWVRMLARRIGDASYSIYLTHTFVIAPSAKIVVVRLFPEMPLPLFIVLMLLATTITGYFVYRFVERPLIKIWTKAVLERSVGHAK